MIPSIAKGLFATAGATVIGYSISSAITDQVTRPSITAEEEKVEAIATLTLEQAKAKYEDTHREFTRVLKQSFELLPDEYKPAFNLSALQPPPLVMNPDLDPVENYELHTHDLNELSREIQNQVTILRDHPYVLAPPVLRHMREAIPNLHPLAEYTELFLSLAPSDQEPIYLPVSDEPEGDFIVDRSARFVKAILDAAAVVGTFLGVLSQTNIADLRRQQESLAGKHNLLVHAASKRDSQQWKIVSFMDELRQAIEIQARLDPGFLAAKLENAMTMWENSVDSHIRTVQQLQNHRLAVGTLTAHQLELLHERVTELAQEGNYQPLTKKSSDYYQIDVSYFRNGKDLMMILHVPCLDPINLLTLYRYLPFPIPAGLHGRYSTRTLRDALTPRIPLDQDGQPVFRDPQPDWAYKNLYPQPETYLIAVSDRQQYRLISDTDLLTCDKNGPTYICDEMNALRTDRNQTCLGSLFFRSEGGVFSYCSFKQKHANEEVFQLSPNQYLVYAPNHKRGQVSCPNGTSFIAHLGEVTKLTIPMGCQVILEDHVLTAPTHYSLHPPSNVYAFSFHPLELPADMFREAPYVDAALNRLSQGMKELKNETDRKVKTLRDHTDQKVNKLNEEATLDSEFGDMLVDYLKRPHILAIVIWSAVSLVLAVILGLFIYCLVRRLTRRAPLTLDECVAELKRMLPQPEYQPSAPTVIYRQNDLPEFTEDSSSEELERRRVHNKRR